MTHDPQSLINGYLDEILTEHEEAALNDWIKADPANAAVFAERVRIHDRLQSILTRQATTIEPSRTPRGRSWRRIALAGGSLAIGLLVFLALWSSSAPEANASTELDRLIDIASNSGARVYRINSLDPNPLPIEPRQAPIDGAVLYVGPPDRYVLIRHFPDGREYATGFDGEHNWAAPPDGAVRLSRDPLRFRWPLPGHQYGIPFADLRSDLVQLRDAYIVTPIGTNQTGKRGLLATKKSAEYRGPNLVELWYDPVSGVIQQMVFTGLPRARGGPDSVSVELLEQRALTNDFFRHDTHHSANRRVIEED